MAEREIERWITVKGRRVPIYSGQSTEDAIKEMQIARNQEEAKKRNAEDTGKVNELNKDGSITMTYVHVPNKNTQNFGSQYGQNIEPAGEYMSMDTTQGRNKIDGYEYGTIHFKKPLILEHKSTDDKGWKKDLSEMFDGKKKKALSNAIKKAGYDAVMTYEIYKGKKEWVEIVNLNGEKR